MKNILIIKKSSVSLLMSIALVALFSIVYVYVFVGLLEVGDTEGLGFNGIVQSDTIAFMNIYQQSNISAYLEAGVKNTVLPASLWSVLDGNWYLATLINVVLLFFTALYLKKIANHLQIKINNKKIFFVVLLPETFIYLIGVLKEIPSLFIFTALTYYFLKKRWLLFVMFFGFLLLFRYQFILCIGLFLLGNKIFKENNIKFLVAVFTILSASYPFLIQHVAGLGLDDAKLYRELGPGLGIGLIVEEIQSNIYGLSFFATIVRLFQMIVEPWPIPNIFDGDNVSVIALVYSVSAVILLPIWFKYFRLVSRVLKCPSSISQDARLILCISFAFIMMVALNGFIHHRYLYPGIGLIILVAYTPVTRFETGVKKCRCL